MPTSRAKKFAKSYKNRRKNKKASSMHQAEAPPASPPLDVPSRRPLGAIFLEAYSTVRCLAIKHSCPKGSSDGCSSANQFLVGLIEAFINSGPYICIQLENSKDAF
ncbi:hypothetical protein Adt_46382 [Abeliophyllum distichum]|uniref:Uncharacterized protein n=1 Tax=Abeliophyllum distichum TaxID=126358 RepID=A0ABD1P0J7_9LAMI